MAVLEKEYNVPNWKRESFLKFYLDNLPVIPPDSRFRYYRFRIVRPNKSYFIYKVKKIIKYPEDLQKQILMFFKKGLFVADVWVSTSLFLNPVQVGSKSSNMKKPGYKWANNIFLGSGFFIDMDVNDIKGCKKLISYLLRKYGFTYIKLLKTHRGYQIHIYDHLTVSEPRLSSPFEREKAMEKLKVKILKDLKFNFPEIKFDELISIDTRRIVRVENTLHSKGTIIEKVAI